MRLGDLDALKEDFKSRLADCNEWIEKAKDKETKIRASAVKTFIGEVIMTIDNAPTVEVDKDFIDKIRATGNFKNGYQLAKNYYKRQQGECTERKCCECFKRAKETRTLLFCEAVGKCKFEKGGAE